MKRVFFSIVLAWLVIACDTNAASLKTLYNFDSAPSLIPSLTLGSDGSIYGVAEDGGGDFGRGFIFKVDPAGKFETLLSFNETNQTSSYMSVLGCSALWLDEAESIYWLHGDTAFCRTKNGAVRTVASSPGRNIIQFAQGRDNSLYGIVGSDWGSDWTTCDYGFVRINTNGECTVLGSFDYSAMGWPHGELTLAHDGTFFGVATPGYGSRNVTCFRVTTNGEVTVLGELLSPAEVPLSWTEAGDGMFYGVSVGLGTVTDSGETVLGSNSILRVSTSGVSTSVFELQGIAGRSSCLQLAAGPDGALYGTLEFGGDGLGSIFRLDTNGSLTTFYSFDGAELQAPRSVRFMKDRSMVGTTRLCGSEKQLYNGAVFRLVGQRDPTVLAGFPMVFGYPDSPLVEAESGVFYGTTPYGGAMGFGAIYQITSSGALKTVAEFSYTNGTSPIGGLTLAPDGSLYGVTSCGGSLGGGTVFRMTREGALTTLVSFDGTNGAYPQGPPVFGKDGALYGTTTGAGVQDSGSVYRLETNGNLTVIARFSYTNGALPMAPLALGADGAFYGTTIRGGPTNLGTVFRVTAEGDLSVVASFVDCTRASASGLVLADDGAFYGTTTFGSGSTYSTVFKITTDGSLSTIYAATNYCVLSGISKGRDGRLYGTSRFGMISNVYVDSVFCVNTNGIFKTLCSWPSAITSQFSQGTGGVTLGSDGVFYGVMSDGGSHFGGTVFRFDLATHMQPPVRTWDGWTIGFDGIPGDDHRILRAPQPQGLWTEVANVVAGEDGTAQWTDPVPLSSNAFYRVVSP